MQFGLHNAGVIPRDRETAPYNDPAQAFAFRQHRADQTGKPDRRNVGGLQDFQSRALASRVAQKVGGVFAGTPLKRKDESEIMGAILQDRVS